MNKVLILIFLGLSISSCGLNNVNNESSQAATAMSKLIGEWKSVCSDGDDGNGNNQSFWVIFTIREGSSPLEVKGYGKIEGYSGHGCLGSPIFTADVNGNLITGEVPLTDVITYQEPSEGLPSKYLLTSDQGIDLNGDPDGSPTNQVFEVTNSHFYVLSIGTNVTGTSWTDWKASSAVVTQFETDPEGALQNFSEDSSGTSVLKLIKQ